MNEAATLAMLLVVAFWFSIFIGLHLLSFRSRKGDARSLITGSVSCFALTLLSIAALSLWLDDGRTMIISTVTAALSFACLFNLYVPALYAILTSISVATLIFLRNNGGRLPRTSLYDHFATGAIMRQRLSVLVASGYLVEDPRGFSLTARGRGMARTFAFVKNLWRLGPGG